MKVFYIFRLLGGRRPVDGWEEKRRRRRISEIRYKRFKHSGEKSQCPGSMAIILEFFGKALYSKKGLTTPSTTIEVRLQLFTVAVHAMLRTSH
ncbi:unnamed protein product [Caenorhabditis auriculariae]|uniref:Uncharacterized protein n=1 Tax=Caenorhabditis auriculariae TaxID=2777116 RepID=A0A8S1HLV5_9PELO|nr:unnamed protein product [Caenorhabditis auriculariae]